jgi:hypothetical protein
MTRLNWLMILSQWVYRTAVKLYPLPFRVEFEEEMVWLFNETCQEALTRTGYMGLTAVWLRTIADFAISLGEQHWLIWRGMTTMNDDAKLLRLITTINIAVIGIVAVIMSGWGIYAAAFHTNGLLPRPAITLFWSTFNFETGAHDPNISAFIVYRAAADEETICSSLPIEAYQVIPQDNLRSGRMSTPENKPAVWYELKDNYRMKRGDLFCYQIVGMTDSGITRSFIHHKAAAPGYNWGLIAMGVLAAVVGMGLFFLARQTLRLAGKIAEPVTAA